MLLPSELRNELLPLAALLDSNVAPEEVWETDNIVASPLLPEGPATRRVPVSRLPDGTVEVFWTLVLLARRVSVIVLLANVPDVGDD